MTKELIENIRAIIVPYMAHDLKRINYENMGEIDAEQFSEDMNEILDLAAKALEQEPIIDVSNVPHKIAEFFSNWDGDENAKMEISVNDMRKVADVYRRKARAERQLKEKTQDYNPDEWCRTCSEYDHEKHCCPRYNRVIRKAVEEMKQPCEDKIIEWKKDFKEYVNSLSIPRDDYKGIMEYIDELPVTPKPKVGHWIFDEIFDRHYYCSECKSMGVDYWNYCPYCGCRMVEPQESEEE